MRGVAFGGGSAAGGTGPATDRSVVERDRPQPQDSQGPQPQDGPAMSKGGEAPDGGEHPRFFVGCDDNEGEELLDPGRVMGYDCLYENVEEEEEDEDDEMYDSVS